MKSDLEVAAMSINDARSYLGGISRNTLDQFADRGLIVSKKLGRRRIVLRASMDKYLASLPDFRIAA